VLPCVDHCSIMLLQHGALYSCMNVLSPSTRVKGERDRESERRGPTASHTCIPNPRVRCHVALSVFLSKVSTKKIKQTRASELQCADNTNLGHHLCISICTAKFKDI
jgi:hypothetical protein